MADYGRIFSRIWTDPDFTALDASAQQLYCLLISYPTRNHAGILPMTLKRWARCTAGATVATVKDALAVLSHREFVVLDWDTEEVLIRTYIRNDEVYKQPNVMQSARKSAVHIESERLRWALHDELERLPSHTHDDKTAEVANSLVEGLTRTLAEPFANPSRTLREGFGEPPGVGESYVGKEYSPSPTPSPIPYPDDRTPPACIDTSARPAKQHPSSSAKLVVRQELGTAGYPRTTLDRLAIQAEKLYTKDHPDSLIRESLREWDRRENAIPEWLESIYGDVVKKARAEPGNTGRPKHKMRVLAELAIAERAKEQAALETANQKALP